MGSSKGGVISAVRPQSIGEEIGLEPHTSIVVFTHSIEEALFLSDRVVVLTQRPGRVLNEYVVPFPRPRTLEVMAGREVFDLTHRIKADIYGLHHDGDDRRAAE